MTRDEVFGKLKVKILFYLEECKDLTDETWLEDFETAKNSITFKELFGALPGWERHSMTRILISCIIEDNDLAEEINDLIDDTW